MTRIPFVRPRLPRPEAWAPELDASYALHQFTNFGPAHERFSAELTTRFCPPGRQATLASSCTTGLAAALIALDVRGRVAIPSFTFPATVQAVTMAGCEPEYIEADPRHWHISADHLARVLERRGVSAVIAVRVFGLCMELSYVHDLCRHHGIPLIIDSAAALPGTFRDGRPAGGEGEIEVFSLHATKVFAIGEGGVVMSDPAFRPSLRSALNFGIRRNEPWGRGFNGKLPEVSCAVGLEVLKGIDARVERGRAVADWYREILSEMPVEQPGEWAGLPPWQTYPVLLPSREAAEEVAARAAAEHIEVRRGYQPALHRAYELGGERLPVAERLSDCIVCFPVLQDMTDQERDRIGRLCAGIRDVRMVA